MVIDYTITIGNIIEVVSIITGGLLVLVKLNSNLLSLKNDVSGMQSEIKKIGDILIGMARFDEKLSGLTTRLNGHDREIYEIKHGRGFVQGSRGGIDGEYP
jgi:hypothetical protein